jgi:hypothetical protein
MSTQNYDYSFPIDLRDKIPILKSKVDPFFN